MTRRSRTLDQSSHIALERFATARSVGHIGREIIEDVESSLARLSPSDINWADGSIANAVRLWRRAEQRSSLLGLFQPHVDDLDMLDREHDLARVFIFHRHGFVRERALLLMKGGLTSGFMVAAMAWRLNDWVRPVRLAALLSFNREIALTNAGVILEAAPYLLGCWSSWQRWDAEQAIALDNLFSRPDVVLAIYKRLREGTSGPLAYMLRQMLRGPRLDDSLRTLASDAAEPAVRATALRTLLYGEARWPEGFGREWVDKSLGVDRRVTVFGRRDVAEPADKAELIRQGLRDRSAAVRLVAADFLTRRSDQHLFRVEVECLSKDRSAAVRARADYLTRQISANDVLS